jgi:DNA modification methylase
LHHLDNRKLSTLKKLEDRGFEAIVTDPEYGLERNLVTHVTRTSINKGVPWDKLDVGWVLKYAPKLAAGGHLIVFCPLEAIGDYRAVCKKAKLTWRGSIIWHKTNPGTVHRPTYLSSCEAIIWATKGGDYHFKPWRNGGAKEVHNFKEGPLCMGNERLNHPTQKPEWIMEELLRRHVHVTHKVLDPFAGVGTTLVVCKKLRISCVGIEKEQRYVRLAIKRLKATDV